MGFGWFWGKKRRAVTSPAVARMWGFDRLQREVFSGRLEIWRNRRWLLGMNAVLMAEGSGWGDQAYAYVNPIGSIWLAWPGLGFPGVHYLTAYKMGWLLAGGYAPGAAVSSHVEVGP